MYYFRPPFLAISISPWHHLSDAVGVLTCSRVRLLWRGFSDYSQKKEKIKACMEIFRWITKIDIPLLPFHPLQTPSSSLSLQKHSLSLSFQCEEFSGSTQNPNMNWAKQKGTSRTHKNSLQSSLLELKYHHLFTVPEDYSSRNVISFLTYQWGNNFLTSWNFVCTTGLCMNVFLLCFWVDYAVIYYIIEVLLRRRRMMPWKW